MSFPISGGIRENVLNIWMIELSIFTHTGFSYKFLIVLLQEASCVSHLQYLASYGCLGAVTSKFIDNIHSMIDD